ncbi:formate hydrogenlyase subunit 3 [Klebsiella pneumoniae subsp. rhinoscleromatis]|nr:formate hydrogenlyase subunit 3 [Klebsiella pneumoniae subsp. rhinoscleromatis]
MWFRTGHRDIEKLGGIGKKMPLISLAMLVGLMAMAALPPLNGFAGEWVIYQSFFKMSTGDLFIGRLLGPLLAVGLAITGALAGDVYGESLRRDLPRRGRGRKRRKTLPAPPG